MAESFQMRSSMQLGLFLDYYFTNIHGFQSYSLHTKQNAICNCMVFGQPLRSIVIPEPWYTGQIDEEELDDTARKMIMIHRVLNIRVCQM